MAVKADVREETDRLVGHVDSARALIAGDGPSGRRLDFLTQEFMREANAQTIENRRLEHDDVVLARRRIGEGTHASGTGYRTDQVDVDRVGAESV